MTTEDAFKVFFATIDGFDIPINYENEDFKPVLGEPYARFTVGGTSTSRESVGLCGTNLIEGEALIEIFTPALKGTTQASELAALIEDAADAYQVPDLQFVEPVFVDTGRQVSTSWWVQPVAIPYQTSKKRA